MSELEALNKILAYITENKLNSALEAKEDVVIEANKSQIPREGIILAIEPKPPDKPKMAEDSIDKQHLDCIYDDEPLGFEKDPMAPEKMQPQDPLEEVNLGKEGTKDQHISASISTKS